MIIDKTGWTWEYLDECLTMPRAAALLDYWVARSGSPPPRPGRALRAERLPGLGSAGPLPDWATGT